MAGKSKDKGKPREKYLAIPYHILNVCDVGLCQKVLLAHICSFGLKGCYQSNKTLADIFMVSAKTISRWLADIRKYVYIKKPKGYYRTIWAKSHPDFRVHLDSPVHRVGQNWVTDLNKSEIGPGQKCPTTNIYTNKETNKDTTAPPSPMPAGGQAPAVLAERNKQSLSKVEQLKRAFGRRRPVKGLSEQQFQQRRQQQLKALLGANDKPAVFAFKQAHKDQSPQTRQIVAQMKT